MERTESRKRLRRWLSDSSKPLLIVGARYTGKTTFIKQLENEPQLAAVHYCTKTDAESLESATILRNLASQLVQHFPNLLIPKLASVTFLSHQMDALYHYLIKPLQSVPSAKTLSFVVIDGMQKDIIPLIIQMSKAFPSWLKLAVTSRKLSEIEMKMFHRFHVMSLDEDTSELISFIKQELPQIHPENVLHCCHGSWFYVSQYSRALKANLLTSPSTSRSQDNPLYLPFDVSLPDGDSHLIEAIGRHMPSHLDLYLKLISSSRRPPSRDRLIAAVVTATKRTPDLIIKDLNECGVILECSDPLILNGAWKERFIGDECEAGHSIWANYIQRTGCDNVQAIIEFAYHLAHSFEPAYMDRVRILRNCGADLVELKCPVFDFLTTSLLLKAGAVIIDNQQQSDFVFACSSGDEKTAVMLVNNVSRSEKSCGLIAAASRGHIQICELVLEKDLAAAMHADKNQWNALRSAACNNHVDVVELLLQKGIDVDECGEGGRTALRAAAWSGHENVVKKLLEAGADLNKQDAEGRTALMAATFMDHANIVVLLLNSGANPNVSDNYGSTALHLALSTGTHSSGHDEVVVALLKCKADVTLVDSNGHSCAHVAAYHGDENLVKIVEIMKNVDLQDHEGRTPLMLAASQGHLRSCQQLIEQGADIDSIDESGLTPLMFAAIGGHLDVCLMLISLGADEGHKDNDGAVALHYAVTHPNVELCRALISPATVQTVDSNGVHALLIAAHLCNIQAVEELLKFDAPVLLQSHDGQSALYAAALSGNEIVVRRLLEYVQEKGDLSFDLNEPNLDGVLLLHSIIVARNDNMIPLLLEYGASPLARDSHGRTCAHIVAQVNDINLAEMLKSAGADFESRDEAGRTPLMTAVWASNYEISRYMLETVAVSPNAVDFQGATALNIAAQNGLRDMVILLLKFGAEPSIRDNLGRSAADVAQLADHEQIRQILKKAGGSAESSGFGSLPSSPSEQLHKNGHDERNSTGKGKGHIFNFSRNTLQGSAV